MEKLLLCQAAAIDPEDRQVSSVCTYHIMTRGERGRSQLPDPAPDAFIASGGLKREKQGCYFIKTLQQALPAWSRQVT